MKACAGRLRGLSREGLEDRAYGRIDCEPCETELAQLVLAEIARREARPQEGPGEGAPRGTGRERDG